MGHVSQATVNSAKQFVRTWEILDLKVPSRKSMAGRLAPGVSIRSRISLMYLRPCAHSMRMCLVGTCRKQLHSIECSIEPNVSIRISQAGVCEQCGHRHAVYLSYMHLCLTPFCVVFQDVSNVKNMIGLFDGAKEFNQDLSTWTTSRVTSLGTAFRGATKFIGNGLSSWDVTRVTSFGSCFHSATFFNGNISNWDVSRSTHFSHMFIRALTFQQDLSGWDVSSGTDFKAMFHGATVFNSDISGWNVRNGLFFDYMFEDAVAFNVDVSSWDVGNAVSMRGMFEGASSFEIDLCAWAPKLLGRGVRFDGMFTGSGCPTQTYPMATTTAMGPLCYYCSSGPCDNINSDLECQCFEPDDSLQRAVGDYLRDGSPLSAVAKTYGSIIGNWCTDNVTSFDYLFDRAISFNEDISKWTTSKVTSMVRDSFFFLKSFVRNIACFPHLPFL